MNPQKIHNLNNRLRRIPKVIDRLNSCKAYEIKRANDMNRDPVLAPLDAQLGRLNARLAVLMVLLQPGFGR